MKTAMVRQLSVLAMGTAFFAGCGGGEGDSSGDAGSTSTSGGEHGTGAADTGGDGTGTDDTDATGDGVLVSFCNPLTQTGGQAAVLRLTLGEGDDAVIFSANSYTCSNRVGSACTRLTPGTGIPAVVTDEAGTELFATQVDLTPGQVHLLSTNVPESSVTLEHTPMPETMDCANMECNFQFYNELTCGADDPCGWSGIAEHTAGCAAL